LNGPPQLAADYSGRAMGNPHIRLGWFWRRWWGFIVLGAAAGALASYVYGSSATPKYEAETQVLVEDAAGGARQTAGLLPTYAEMVNSTPVLAYALESAKSPESVAELRANVRGESDRNTRLITIRADDTNSAQAVALANGLAAGLERYVSASAAPAPAAPNVEPQPHVQIELVDPATSAARVRPLSPLLVEFGALAGLFGALAFALVTEFRRPNVTDEKDLVEIGGLPVLGSVNGTSARDGSLFLDPTRSLIHESVAYRQLATQIAVAHNEEAPRSLVIVGAGDAEASCAVAAMLALVLAQEGRRVVLLDLEAQHVRRLLGEGKLKGRGGIVTRVTPLKHGDIAFDRFDLRWGAGAPLVVAVPRFVPRGLSPRQAEDLVRVFSEGKNIMIIHSAPPNRSRGAVVWARATKATVLVVRAGQTKRTAVDEARQGLAPAHSKLLGAVLHGGRP
jgi:capsular polysaccharide biosynthesis protein/Mrp family chromosome partitioning ATPase